jgi:hypothetical protein
MDTGSLRMSDDAKLIVTAIDSYTWGLCWYFEEDGEEGAYVGDWGKNLPVVAPTDKEEWESWVAETEAALDSSNNRAFRLSGARFGWESKSGAEACLRRIKARIKAGGRLIEAWERKALDAGWKPPKGWK